MYSKTSFDKTGGLLKALKLEKPGKTNFTHFVSRPLGENVLKDIF